VDSLTTEKICPPLVEVVSELLLWEGSSSSKFLLLIILKIRKEKKILPFLEPMPWQLP
jgi:hypothetical protein